MLNLRCVEELDGQRAPQRAERANDPVRVRYLPAQIINHLIRSNPPMSPQYFLPEGLWIVGVHYLLFRVCGLVFRVKGLVRVEELDFSLGSQGAERADDPVRVGNLHLASGAHHHPASPIPTRSRY